MGDAIERLRNVLKTAFVTYGFVTDESGKLLGLVTMRDLLFAAHDRKLASVMLADPFCLKADMQLADAIKPVLNRHYPVLAGQSGNTGCQALAVTLRGMTLGELRAGAERGLVMKEAALGFLNGTLVGLVAAIGMYITTTDIASMGCFLDLATILVL